MIQRSELAALTPGQRADVILSQARSELSNRLWRAAIGDGDSKDDKTASPLNKQGITMDALMQLLGGSDATAAATQQQGMAGVCTCGACPCCRGSRAVYVPQADDEEHGARMIPAVEQRSVAAAAPALSSGSSSLGTAHSLTLGANARYTATLDSAAASSGIPADTIAAIIGAEAARHRDGSWNPLSRNPRSSAAGLGQFLSSTWQDLAQRKGTTLNQIAGNQGWLDAQGKLRPESRGALLALRYDPDVSIHTVADFAKMNLDRLEAKGLKVRTDTETVSKAAYLSHHLGLGDATRFLTGSIDAGRARMLLHAQIGGAAAEARIAAAGGATQAHRQWLLSYIDRNIHPQQFDGGTRLPAGAAPRVELAATGTPAPAAAPAASSQPVAVAQAAAPTAVPALPAATPVTAPAATRRKIVRDSGSDIFNIVYT